MRVLEKVPCLVAAAILRAEIWMLVGVRAASASTQAEKRQRVFSSPLVHFSPYKGVCVCVLVRVTSVLIVTHG